MTPTPEEPVATGSGQPATGHPATGETSPGADASVSDDSATGGVSGAWSGRGDVGGGESDPADPEVVEGGEVARTTAGGRDALLLLLRLAVIGAAAGLIAGLGWLWVAPRPMLEVRDDAAYYLEGQQQLIIGQDGWFVVIMIATGVAIGLIAYLRWRRFGPVAVIGAVLAAGIAGVVAWRLGVWQGESELLSLPGPVADGTRSLGSLKLRAYGALFVGPVAAALVTLTAVLAYGTGPPAAATRVPQPPHETLDPPQPPEAPSV